MAGCRAVSLRKRNFMELSFGPFSGCKNLVQQIMWIISEWEETAVESAAEIGHVQVQEAERTLYEAKKKLWRLWTTAFQKIEDAQRGGEPRAGHGVTTTSQTAPVETYRRELIVREDNCAALETQREARQRTVVINHSPHTSPLKNLMLEWSVLLDDKGRLCLQGVIPTKGEWVTTPIAQRLDQTKVKTISGTIYNVWGPMVIPPDLNIPKFVQDAFKMGIPVGWKTIVNDWYTFIKQELNEADSDSEMKKMEYPRNSVTATARQQLAVNDNRASNVNYNDQQRSRVELPPPKEPPPKRRYVSEAEDRMSVARKDPISHKMVAEAGTAKDAQNKAELVRFSQRVLNKSVLNNTINEGDEEKVSESE